MGAWSWGVGGNGGDRVFGNTLTKEDLWPVFRRGMELGLNLWDTAAVYGMGASETILGEFVDDCDRDDLYISTKFTPQIAKDVEHSWTINYYDIGFVWCKIMLRVFFCKIGLTLLLL